MSQKFHPHPLNTNRSPCLKPQEALPPPPDKEEEEVVEEKITQGDLIPPYEAGAPLIVTIVSATGLAKVSLEREIKKGRERESGRAVPICGTKV